MKMIVCRARIFKAVIVRNTGQKNGVKVFVVKLSWNFMLEKTFLVQKRLLLIFEFQKLKEWFFRFKIRHKKVLDSKCNFFQFFFKNMIYWKII